MSYMFLRLQTLIAQMLEKSYKVSFENKLYVIKDGNYNISTG